MKYNEGKIDRLFEDRTKRLSLVERIERFMRQVQLADTLYNCGGCTLAQLTEIKDYQKRSIEKFYSVNSIALKKHNLDGKVEDLLSSLSGGRTSNFD